MNSYGKVHNFKGEWKGDCPFRYQGQYEDAETGLYYNRFRYYSPDEGMYISQDPSSLEGGHKLYSYVIDTNSWIDILGLAGQRWEGQTNNDGSPRQKPGPKPKGEGGAHNAKIDEVIQRESAKEGVTHIGGGSKTELVYDTSSTASDYDSRRMDASFEREDGSIYHVNVGLTLKDGETGIARERDALDDMDAIGEEVTFEGYAKACEVNN